MPELVRVFAYGTLMDPDIVSRVLGRPYSADQMYDSKVIGFERLRAGYYYAVPKDGAEIAGVVLTGLSQDDLGRLDHYEGVPHLYSRVEVNRIGGEPIYLYVGEAIARRR